MISHEAIVTQLEHLPQTIYEDAKNIVQNYPHFLVPMGTDGGAQDYVFREFLKNAELIMDSDAYAEVRRRAQLSVHDKIKIVVSKDATLLEILPIERYIETAFIIISTKSYRDLVLEVYVKVRHCVRCHQTYKEGDGTRCKIEHVMKDEYEWRIPGVHTVYYSKCCGCLFVITGDDSGEYDETDLSEELCVDAIHTSTEEIVDYNNVNVKPCVIVRGKCTLQN